MRQNFKVPTIQNNQWVITEEEQQHDHQHNVTVGSCTDDLLDKAHKSLLVEERKHSKVQKYPITEKPVKN